MIKPRDPAARAKLIVTNPPSTADPTHTRLLIRSTHDEGGLEFNPGYLDAPEMMIILRVGQPGFDEPRVAEGDLVIADRRVKPDDGSLVIAVVGGESVVRRLSLSEGGERLYAPEGSCERAGAAEVLATVVSLIPVSPE